MVSPIINIEIKKYKPTRKVRYNMQGSYNDSVEKFQHKQKSKRKVIDKNYGKARREKLKDKWKHTEPQS